MSPAERLLTLLFEAYNHRDFAAFSAGLHPQIDWPDQTRGGRLVGLEALEAYWARNDEIIRVEVTPIEFQTLPDDRLRVQVNQVVRNPSGGLWSNLVVLHDYSFRHGLVSRMDLVEGAASMTSDSRLLIEQLQAAVGARDLEGVLSFLHPEVVIPDYLDDGEVRGHAQVRAFYARMFETLSPGVDVLEVETLADGRICALLQVALHDRIGKIWSDSRVQVTYTLVDGLIFRIET